MTSALWRYFHSLQYYWIVSWLIKKSHSIQISPTENCLNLTYEYTLMLIELSELAVRLKLMNRPIPYIVNLKKINTHS